MFKGIQSMAKFRKDHEDSELTSVTVAIFNLNGSLVGLSSTFEPIYVDGKRTGDYELIEYVMGNTFGVKAELMAQGFVWDSTEKLYKRVRQTTPKELGSLETGIKGAIIPDNIDSLDTQLVLATVNYSELP